MNVFNKLVVIILLLVLLAFSLMLALFPAQTLQAISTAFAHAASWVQALAANQPLLYALGRVGLAVLALVVVLPVLWQQIRRRRPRAVRVITEGGSAASVTTDSVARRLAWHIDQLADVVSVEPHVWGTGKAVNVRLDVQTRPEIDVPMKTDEIVSVAKEVITERMGLQLGKVQVHIDHAPYTEGVA
jgi:hypothetical protein